MPSADKPCSSCGHAVVDLDIFCPSCGAQTTPAAGRQSADTAQAAAPVGPEEHRRRNSVSKASKAILYLSIIFAISGLIMFGVQGSENDKSLKNLDGHAADEVFVVEGKSYSVAELRTEIEREPIKVLVLNLALAGIMLGLYAWARKNPLPAMIVAFSIFAIVHIANAMADPKTIPQGIFIKIIMTTLLVRGIRDAIQSRKAEPALLR